MPLLFWFWILFILFYFFVFSYFLSFFFYTFKTRLFLFNELINSSYNIFYFYELFLYFCNDFLSRNFFNTLFVYFNNLLGFSYAKILDKKFFLLK